MALQARSIRKHPMQHMKGTFPQSLGGTWAGVERPCSKLHPQSLASSMMHTCPYPLKGKVIPGQIIKELATCIEGILQPICIDESIPSILAICWPSLALLLPSVGRPARLQLHIRTYYPAMQALRSIYFQSLHQTRNAGAYNTLSITFLVVIYPVLLHYSTSSILSQVRAILRTQERIGTRIRMIRIQLYKRKQWLACLLEQYPEGIPECMEEVV